METNIIQIDYQEHLAVVRLIRGTTNPINAQLVGELSGALQELRHDPKVHGLVLTSVNDKFFSIGFDIPELFELPMDEFKSFYRAFNRLCLALYTFPKPTVAAITGHAIAGGCILALCCDLRFIADGRKLMGLNEVKLGVPVPYPADRILRDLVGSRYTRQIVEKGEFYTPDQAFEMGLVDRVLPLVEVLPASLEEADALGANPREAYAAIKYSRVELVQAQIMAGLEGKESRFVELWYSPTTRPRLREAMEKF